MQNSNIGVCFQRSQGHWGLYSSMFFSSWRNGFMEYVNTLKIQCLPVASYTASLSIAFRSVSPWEFPLWCLVDPLLWIWQQAETGGVHLDLVRFVVKTGLLGAGLSQHTILMFSFAPLKPLSPLFFRAQCCFKWPFAKEGRITFHYYATGFTVGCYLWISRYYISQWFPLDGAGRISLRLSRLGLCHMTEWVPFLFTPQSHVIWLHAKRLFFRWSN